MAGRTDEDLGSMFASSILGPEWITPAEAALLVGASPEDVIAAIEDQRLRAWTSRDGTRTLIPASDLTTVLVGPANEFDWRLPAPPAEPTAPAEPTSEEPASSAAEPAAAAAEPPVYEGPIAPPWPLDTITAFEAPDEAGAIHTGASEPAPPIVADALDSLEWGELGPIHQPDERDDPEIDPAHGERDRDTRRRTRHIWPLVVLLLATGLLLKTLLLTPGAHHSAAPATDPSIPTAGGPPLPGASTVAPTAPADAGAPPPSPSAAAADPKPPSSDHRLFIQHGRRLTAVAMVRNPNDEFAIRSMSATFVVRDRKDDVLARRDMRISVPPGGSVRVLAPDILLQARPAAAASVRVELGRPRWTPAASFPPSALQVEGAGFSSSGPGDLTIVASVTNTGGAGASGTLICVAQDAAGRLTAAVATKVSLRRAESGPFFVPVSRPGAGSISADCEFVPPGR